MLEDQHSESSPWKEYAKDIKSVVVEKGVATNYDAHCLFAKLSECEKMDLANLDTSMAGNMIRMFEGCKKLEILDLSGFNTENVKFMPGMFSKCSSLRSLNLNSFNTKNVINMGSMFYECESLKILDIRSFDMSNVKDVGSMCAKCTNLEKLLVTDLNWPLKTLGNLSGVFFMCTKLKDMSGLDWEMKRRQQKTWTPPAQTRPKEKEVGNIER